MSSIKELDEPSIHEMSAPAVSVSERKDRIIPTIRDAILSIVIETLKIDVRKFISFSLLSALPSVLHRPPDFFVFE